MTESATRAAYDSMAVLYADTFRDVMDDLPLDRAMIAAFAELVRGALPVADLGCGPGFLTAHLASLGLSAFGVDLSPGMLAQARKEYPDLRFDEGTMASLDLADESLGGILAWYSIIHTAPDELPRIFAEFHRVLAPGGHVLVGFQTCEAGTPEPFDHKVALAYRWSPDGLSAVLRRAGLVEAARFVRQPTSIHERTPAGVLLLRKP
ncbi:methyltransferase family protein [Actinomadura pelletieri DSM 43383]|uniref:Methyltransferase family protein n=1 Tax=Actinomadura pelletieri DSM 43383 TaxID=1120940 RepID=A0A495QUR1_9ACTN|nr:class I SAM-dependent methyltransferase [Actinomadura pelletieri]RKS77239.1 methyltransferase family protein [Actinomadura pelletieri DSM 43383]